MKAQTSLIDELIVDNFAGGGGTSTGIELALGRPVDIAINHDPDAVAMHRANHPYTKHYCESVWDIDPVVACAGRVVGLAWFSPDCKHFSKAKGGKPVNKNIRGLAWIVLRWAAKVKPRVIMLENVEEFKTWGPIRNGKPVKARSGETFQQWKGQLESLGYTVEMKELRACDYGTPTIRKRFFIIARCDGRPIVWPEPTHGDPKSEAVMSGKLKPWRTAAEIIDWSLPCPSIFDTAEEIWEKHGLRAVRPLADATLRRIARGMKKFVFDNPEPFVVDFKFDNRPRGAGEPMNTITAVNGYGLAVSYVMPNNNNNVPTGATDPIPTVTTGNRNFVITPTLIQYHDEQSEREVRGQEVGKPIMTVDASPRYAMVSAFLSKYYAGGYEGAGSAATCPLHTVTGIDHNAVVAANLIKLQQNSVGQTMDEPMHTVMPGAPRFGLVTTNLVTLRNNCIGQAGDEPLRTVTASGGHFGEVRTFLMKYYGQGSGQNVADPLHTATAQDRFGFVTIQGTQYAIVDIGLRMLTPRELFAANGFPPDYAIDKDYTGKAYPKSKQVARCGNAVPPQFAEALVRANLPEMCGGKIKTMAQLEAQIAV